MRKFLEEQGMRAQMDREEGAQVEVERVVEEKPKAEEAWIAEEFEARKATALFEEARKVNK